MKSGKVITGIIILFIISFPVFSYSFEGVQITAGKAFILNAEPVETSPAPGFASSMFGFSVPMKLSALLYFEPGLRIYASSVVLDSEGNPVPAAIETMNRISVLHCEFRPEFGAEFEINKNISLGLTGAPVMNFRFPVIAYDDAVAADQKTVAGQYFFSKARFLGFYAGGFFSWVFSENTRLNVKLGTSLPVYHLWDGEDTAFYDQLIIEPEIGIVFRF